MSTGTNTLGKRPYSLYKNNFKKFYDDLVRDKRLSKPCHMPDKVYGLLMKCWINVDKQVDKRRPTFREAMQFFEEILEDERQGRLADTDENSGMNDRGVGSNYGSGASWRTSSGTKYHRNSQNQ